MDHIDDYDFEPAECIACAESGANPDTGLCEECEAEQHFQNGKAKQLCPISADGEFR